MSEEVLLTELCSGLWCITSTTGLAVCIDGNTLDQLPEDGNLTQLRVIAIDSPTMDTPTSTASTSTSSSAPITSTSPDDVILTCNSSLIDAPYDSYCAHLPQLFVPTAMRSMTEQETVVKAVEERQSSSLPSSSSTTLMCPSIGGMPINEFITDSYFTCHFPTLFPTGAADFSCQGRQNQVTIFNKHITTMHIWSVFASMYNHTLLYLTLWSNNFSYGI